MENYYYLCPQCGYHHQVPAYWLSYSPSPEFEAEHIDFSTCQPCANTKLIYDSVFTENNQND